MNAVTVAEGPCGEHCLSGPSTRRLRQRLPVGPSSLRSPSLPAATSAARRVVSAIGGQSLTPETTDQQQRPLADSPPLRLKLLDSRNSLGGTEPDGSSGFLPLVLDGGAFVGRVLRALHCGFETANPVSDSFAEFRKLLRPEHEQSNPKNHQQMHGLKKSFEHFGSLL